MLSSSETVPTTTVTFSKNAVLENPPSNASQRFWDALWPIGDGFVNVSHPESYGLLPGVPTDSGTDIYSVAMFHQLHCIVRTAEFDTKRVAKLINSRVCFAVIGGSSSMACPRPGQIPSGRRCASSYETVTLSTALRTLLRASCVRET